MPLAVKLLAYRGARAIGLFSLAQWITRGRLRILAYHGFAAGDALQFRPKLFVSAEVFERRMKALKTRGFRVLGLNEAVEGLCEGRRFNNEVVITIDDGYASTLSVAAPILRRHEYPATVYVTTYHVQKQTPVFDLVLAYMLWKTSHQRLDWPWPSETQLRSLDLSTAGLRDVAASRLLDHGHRLDGEPARVAMCEALGEALAVSYKSIEVEQWFRLMSADELGRITAAGVDVALHTHRHRFPLDDPDACRRELLQNQVLLHEMTGTSSSHFCYPSGVYAAHQWVLLSDLGVRSATTCETGMVRRGDSVYGLRRFLDGEMVSDVEFDAEICGFAELLRSMLRVRRQAAHAL